LNRDAFHSVFEKHLQEIQPKEELIATFLKIIERAKEKNEVKYKDNTEVLKKEINKIDNKIQKYIERIGETKSDTLIENYEKQIQTLEDEKLEKNKKLTDTNTSV
jgi:DNA replication protein DnaD